MIQTFGGGGEIATATTAAAAAIVCSSFSLSACLPANLHRVLAAAADVLVYCGAAILRMREDGMLHPSLTALPSSNGFSNTSAAQNRGGGGRLPKTPRSETVPRAYCERAPPRPGWNPLKVHPLDFGLLHISCSRFWQLNSKSVKRHSTQTNTPTSPRDENR